MTLCLIFAQSLVPETHKLRITWTPGLEGLLNQDALKKEVIEPIKAKFNIDVSFASEREHDTQTINLTYTRNNAGNLEDAVYFLTTTLARHGINSEPIKGGIQRPKSDTFEDAFPHFNSKVLQSAPPLMGAEEVKRLSGEVTAGMQADLQKLIGAQEACFDNTGAHSKPPGSAGSTTSGSSRHNGSIGNNVGVVGQETIHKRLSVSSTGSGGNSNIWTAPGSSDGEGDWPTGGMIGSLVERRKA